MYSHICFEFFVKIANLFTKGKIRLVFLESCIAFRNSSLFSVCYVCTY